ncbi:hypothetical protein KCP69_08165 [Salmonella enterica subsp. enterica]|nr:hypothetical protein KCP69_08165 [Salmonella enterica subsp. enterica]
MFPRGGKPPYSPSYMAYGVPRASEDKPAVVVEGLSRCSRASEDKLTT